MIRQANDPSSDDPTGSGDQLPEGIPAMTQYVIYENPTDFPTQCVCRKLFILPGKIVAEETPHCVGTLIECRESVPDGLYCLTRHPSTRPLSKRFGCDRE